MSRPVRDRASDMRKALDRDLARHERRERGHKSFWRSMGLLGMVGWPIALGAAGGSILGHYIDTHLESGIRFTLLLLFIGLVLGSFVAWKTLRQHDSHAH